MILSRGAHYFDASVIAHNKFVLFEQIVLVSAVTCRGSAKGRYIGKILFILFTKYYQVCNNTLCVPPCK